MVLKKHQKSLYDFNFESVFLSFFYNNKKNIFPIVRRFKLDFRKNTIDFENVFDNKLSCWTKNTVAHLFEPNFELTKGGGCELCNF